MKKLIALAAVLLISCAHVKVTPEQADKFCNDIQDRFAFFLEELPKGMEADGIVKNLVVTDQRLYCKELTAYGVYSVELKFEEEGQTICVAVDAVIKFDEVKGEIKYEGPEILKSEEIPCPAST